jgi:hypothetical protein
LIAEKLMMRTVLMAMAIALLSVPAHAQGYGLGSGLGKGKRHQQQTPAVDPAKKKADEKAYNDALKSIPDSKAKTDPWGTMR